MSETSPNWRNFEHHLVRNRFVDESEQAFADLQERKEQDDQSEHDKNLYRVFRRLVFIDSAFRYDVKGKSTSTPLEVLLLSGLRNARLNQTGGRNACDGKHHLQRAEGARI